jgi:hypothetical protein
LDELAKAATNVYSREPILLMAAQIQINMARINEE